MAAPTSTNEVTARKLSASISALWTKIKSTFQLVSDRVTAWGSTPSDTKYPSEKLVKTSLDAKAADSAVLHKAGLETASGQKWFEGGFCVFNSSHIGYGHFTLAGAGCGPIYNDWTEEQKDGAHFREWSLSFNSGVNFWGKIRITIATSYSGFNASGSMQKTINCAFNTMTVFNNTGYYNDLGIKSENEFRISDLIWNNTTECWEIKIHSIKPTSNNGVPVLLIEFWTHSTSNRDSALGIHWVSTSPSIVTDTTYYTKRSGNASTSPGTGGVQFNWADKPVFQSPYGYEIFDRSHTIPVGNGGTGKTTAKAAEYNLTTGKSEISDTTSGDDRVVFELASPSESNGVTRGFRKLSTIWTWVKGLLSSESGVNISGSSASCTGNAATATELSAGADRTKLDGIEPNANNYTHPTSGANTSKGDTTAQTPSFGQTFKVLSATVDAMGHTTAIAEHTVKIPDSVAEGGPGGNSGLMSYQDKDRLDLMSDEANKVEASTNNGNIKIDGEETTVYAHPTSGANTSKGDTTAQTPGFGQTFKALSATVDSLGHTTSLAEHTVKIPNGLATGGPSGDRGLMSSADKDRLDLARVNVISTFFGTRSYTPVQYLANYVGDVGNWSNDDNYDTSLLRVGDVVKFYVTVPLMANAHFIIDVKLDTVPGANAECVHGMTLAMYQADPHEPLDGTGSDADNFVIPGHYTIRNVTQITNKWPGSTAGDSDYTNLIVSRMVPNDVDIGSSSAYAINQLVLWRRRYLARDRYKSGNNWVWGAWQQFTYQDSNYAATGNVNRPVYVDENGMIKPCTYTWIVGSLGSASNTIYFT